MYSIIDFENAMNRLRYAKAALNKIIVAAQAQYPNDCENEDTDALCGVYDLLDQAYNDLLNSTCSNQIDYDEAKTV